MEFRLRLFKQGFKITLFGRGKEPVIRSRRYQIWFNIIKALVLILFSASFGYTHDVQLARFSRIMALTFIISAITSGVRPQNRMWVSGIATLVFLLLGAYFGHIHDTWVEVLCGFFAVLSVVATIVNGVRRRTARMNCE